MRDELLKLTFPFPAEPQLQVLVCELNTKVRGEDTCLR